MFCTPIVFCMPLAKLLEEEEFISSGFSCYKLGVLIRACCLCSLCGQGRETGTSRGWLIPFRGVRSLQGLQVDQQLVEIHTPYSQMSKINPSPTLSLCFLAVTQKWNLLSPLKTILFKLLKKQGQFGKHWLIFRPDFLKILKNLKV